MGRPVRSFDCPGRLVGWGIAETGPDIAYSGRGFLRREVLDETEVAVSHEVGDLLVGESVRV